MTGPSTKTPPLPDPVPTPIETDAQKAQDDIQRRLAKSRGRAASSAAGFLSTPPIVSDIGLSDTLG